MEAGHTKFCPDWHFGIFKSKWRHTSVETIDQIAECVHLSSKNRHNIPQLVEDSDKPVIFYDWASFLKPILKPIPHLKQYHHFRMSSDKPGVVAVRQYASDAEQEVNILKCLPANASQLPPELKPKGLDPARQWYLYEEISQHCLNRTDACPRPSVPKPVNVKSEENGKRKKCAES